MLLHHVIMTSYCCQRYAKSLVTTLCSSRTVRQCTSSPRRARATVELQRLETPNFLAPNLRPPNSPDLCPVDYKIWSVMQHRVNHRHIHSVDDVKWRLIDVWRALEQSILDEATDQWWERHQTRVHAKDDTSSTACELTMLILSISVTLNVTCLTFTQLYFTIR